MKAILTKTLAITLAAATLSVTADARDLGTKGANDLAPKVTYLTVEYDEPIADALLMRAEENGWVVDWGDGLLGGVGHDWLLTEMIRDLLAAEPEPIVAPRTETEFFSLCSGFAQELILELIHVRTYGTSSYFSPRTLWKVRDPAVNDALITLLVRSTR